MANYDVDLFDGIEIFFDALKAKSSTDAEYAAAILKARGFLLEDAELVLSDNSHSDDARYLNKLLTKDNLGYVEDNRIFLRPNANVEKIFYRDTRIGGEAFSNGASWKKFVHDSFAPKVPVRWLEPFVARYVKAISACGAETWCSCDGNHLETEQRILIEFTDKPNDLWHELICKKLLGKRFNLNRSCGYSKIRFDKANKWQTYSELNRAAEFLYDNRLKLRQIRSEASNAISLKMLKSLPADELAKIFSERANELFDELFKNA